MIEEPIVPVRTIVEYSDDLEKRCSTIDELMMELKLTEEWRSVTCHNIFRSEVVLSLYLETKQWTKLRSNILKAISVVCLLPNSSSISKNKASACSKKYNALRHEIVRVFSSRDVPNISNLTDKNKFSIEWRSTLWSMLMAFITILHKNLPNGNSGKLLAKALADLNTEILPDKSISLTIYYISGWMLTASEKEYLRRGNTIISKYLDILVDNFTCIDGETAWDAGLPTEKVDRLSCGGLKYASQGFFTLICSMEHIFSSVLTNENLALHGGKLLFLIANHIKTNDFVKKQVTAFFISENSMDQGIITEVIEYLVKTYSRMRGKDIVYKIMARGKTNPKLHIRQKCAAVVDVNTYRANEKKKASTANIDASTADIDIEENVEVIDEEMNDDDEDEDHRNLSKLMFISVDSDSEDDSDNDSDISKYYVILFLFANYLSKQLISCFFPCSRCVGVRLRREGIAS